MKEIVLKRLANVTSSEALDQIDFAYPDAEVLSFRRVRDASNDEDLFVTRLRVAVVEDDVVVEGKEHEEEEEKIMRSVLDLLEEIKEEIKDLSGEEEEEEETETVEAEGRPKTDPELEMEHEAKPLPEPMKPPHGGAGFGTAMQPIISSITVRRLANISKTAARVELLREFADEYRVGKIQKSGDTFIAKLRKRSVDAEEVPDYEDMAAPDDDEYQFDYEPVDPDADPYGDLPEDKQFDTGNEDINKFFDYLRGAGATDQVLAGEETQLKAKEKEIRKHRNRLKADIVRRSENSGSGENKRNEKTGEPVADPAWKKKMDKFDSETEQSVLSQIRHYVVEYAKKRGHNLKVNPIPVPSTEQGEHTGETTDNELDPVVEKALQDKLMELGSTPEAQYDIDQVFERMKRIPTDMQQNELPQMMEPVGGLASGQSRNPQMTPRAIDLYNAWRKGHDVDFSQWVPPSDKSKDDKVTYEQQLGQQ